MPIPNSHQLLSGPRSPIHPPRLGLISQTGPTEMDPTSPTQQKAEKAAALKYH
jgi:hypothetical protein